MKPFPFPFVILLSSFHLTGSDSLVSVAPIPHFLYTQKLNRFPFHTQHRRPFPSFHPPYCVLLTPVQRLSSPCPLHLLHKLNSSSRPSLASAAIVCLVLSLCLASIHFSPHNTSPFVVLLFSFSFYVLWHRRCCLSLSLYSFKTLRYPPPFSRFPSPSSSICRSPLRLSLHIPRIMSRHLLHSPLFSSPSTSIFAVPASSLAIHRPLQPSLWPCPSTLLSALFASAWPPLALSPHPSQRWRVNPHNPALFTGFTCKYRRITISLKRGRV